MELVNNSIIAQAKYVGTGQYIIPAGKSLKIETSPAGEEILNVTVPAGKSWAVAMQIVVVESNI